MMISLEFITGVAVGIEFIPVPEVEKTRFRHSTKADLTYLKAKCLVIATIQIIIHVLRKSNYQNKILY